MPGFVIESPVWRLELKARSQDEFVQIVEDIATDARRACPVDTGEMLGTIHTVIGPGRGLVVVGTEHWAPTEYGSSAHEIRPRRPGGRLSFFWLKAGRHVMFRRVWHPGTPAQSFMRAALYRRRRPVGP